METFQPSRHSYGAAESDSTAVAIEAFTKGIFGDDARISLDRAKSDLKVARQHVKKGTFPKFYWKERVRTLKAKISGLESQAGEQQFLEDQAMTAQYRANLLLGAGIFAVSAVGLAALLWGIKQIRAS